MKISKRVREQAALICAVLASTTDCTAGEAATAIGERVWWAANGPAGLAWLARNEACERLGTLAWLARETRWAEAEALLHCGWSP